MRFVAIDVETARSTIDSICQIGICIFQDGREVGQYETLVDPECGFDRMNVAVHGIRDRDVVGAPTFAATIGAINACLRGSIVVSHSHFDRNALSAAYGRVGRPLPESVWLDSIALARRAWPDQADRGGYRLSVLAGRLGIDFRHHDALEDARTAGRIAIAALADSGDTLAQLTRSHGRRVGGPVAAPPPVRGRAAFAAQPSITAREFAGGPGPLAGHRIAFTGTLTLPREDAARLACSFGAACTDSISRKTTLLVVGESVAGTSGKQAKVEQLIAQGESIRILSEAMFLALCDDCHRQR